MTGGPPPLPPLIELRIKELLGAYKSAAERIERELQKAALTSFRKFRLTEHLKQIRKQIAALDVVAQDIADETIRASYRAGAEFGRASLISDGVKVGDLNMGNRIHTAGVQAVTDQMAYDLLSANRSLDTQVRRLLRRTQQVKLDERQINKIISEGIAEGETRRAVSERLREALVKEIGEGVRIKAGGRTFDPDYYAELVARTRTREAVTEGSVRFGQENGIYLFRVSVHQNPCEEICAALQGKVFATVEGTGFPMFEKRPPYHPHCRHCALAFVPKSDEEEEILRQFSNGDRYVPTLREYQDIVKGRSNGAKRPAAG